MREQQIKERVKKRYGKIALTGNNSECCCKVVYHKKNVLVKMVNHQCNL